MTLEKSSKGTLELVEKMMFIRMMQRMKLVTGAPAGRPRQSPASLGRKKQEHGTGPQAPSLAGRRVSREPRGIVKPLSLENSFFPLPPRYPSIVRKSLKLAQRRETEADRCLPH